MARSSRDHAAAPSRRSLAALLLREASPQRPEPRRRQRRRNHLKPRSPAIRRLPRADDRASSRASAQRLSRPRRGRSATTKSRADQRRPCRVPIRFHGALPRRAARRRRSAAMSAAEQLPALGVVPQRRRGDRYRRSSFRKRSSGARSRAAGRTRTRGRSGPDARADADAAPGRGILRLADLRPG